MEIKVYVLIRLTQTWDKENTEIIGVYDSKDELKNKLENLYIETEIDEFIENGYDYTYNFNTVSYFVDEKMIND